MALSMSTFYCIHKTRLWSADGAMVDNRCPLMKGDRWIGRGYFGLCAFKWETRKIIATALDTKNGRHPKIRSWELVRPMQAQFLFAI
jgi:hypothetical protein